MRVRLTSWQLVPILAIDASFGERGVSLEGTIAQAELIWRLWRENIARPGRNAANALGVWGMLARPDKIKHVAVSAAPLVANIVAEGPPPDELRSTWSERSERSMGRERAAGGNGGAVACTPLATIRTTELAFSAFEQQTDIKLTFGMAQLALDVHDAASGALGVLLGDWDFTMRALEVRTPIEPSPPALGHASDLIT